MVFQNRQSFAKYFDAGEFEEHLTQVAALCWRLKDGKPKILLVTSRETRRWVTPKGWPMRGMKPYEAAAQEAWEEAGVKGEISKRCYGVFTYDKVNDTTEVPCAVVLFPMQVRRLVQNFPETKERTVKWFSPKKAAKAVQEPDLAKLLKHFDPRRLRR